MRKNALSLWMRIIEIIDSDGGMGGKKKIKDSIRLLYLLSGAVDKSEQLWCEYNI